MELKQALQQCGGAAPWGQLRGLGVPAHVVKSARSSGLIVGRGAFALPDAPPPLVAAVRLGGVVSHTSAAKLHGFPSWREDPTLHVITASGARASEPGLLLHRARLTPDDVDGLRAITAPLRTVVDCARMLPLVEAVIVLDAALHLRRVRPAELRAAADSARGHGAARLRQAVRFADELAASPLESVLRLLLELLGCQIHSQVYLRGVGYVDLLVNGWLVLEADGYEFHSNRKAYREDRSRGNGISEHGLVLLRYTYEDLRARPGFVLAQVERVLVLGPPRAGVATGGQR